jgi:hypothetical protein
MANGEQEVNPVTYHGETASREVTCAAVVMAFEESIFIIGEVISFGKHKNFSTRVFHLRPDADPRDIGLAVNASLSDASDALQSGRFLDHSRAASLLELSSIEQCWNLFNIIRCIPSQYNCVAVSKLRRDTTLNENYMQYGDFLTLVSKPSPLGSEILRMFLDIADFFPLEPFIQSEHSEWLKAGVQIWTHNHHSAKICFVDDKALMGIGIALVRLESGAMVRSSVLRHQFLRQPL